MVCQAKSKQVAPLAIQVYNNILLCIDAVKVNLHMMS